MSLVWFYVGGMGASLVWSGVGNWRGRSEFTKWSVIEALLWPLWVAYVVMMAVVLLVELVEERRR